MTDRKPPRLAATERETLLALLQYQRDSLIRKVEGADQVAARQSPVGSGTTLLWLPKHLAQAEIQWVVVRFAALDAVLPDDTVQPDDTTASIVAGYRAGAHLAPQNPVGSVRFEEYLRRS